MMTLHHEYYEDAIYRAASYYVNIIGRQMKPNIQMRGDIMKRSLDDGNILWQIYG